MTPQQRAVLIAEVRARLYYWKLAEKVHPERLSGGWTRLHIEALLEEIDALQAKLEADDMKVSELATRLAYANRVGSFAAGMEAAADIAERTGPPDFAKYAAGQIRKALATPE